MILVVMLSAPTFMPNLESVWAEEVIDTILVGSEPESIAYNPDNKNIYVTNSGDDTVSIIDNSNTVIDTIAVERAPRGIAYNSNNNEMYVTNSGDDTVSVIRSSDNMVIYTITEVDEPYGIAYNPANQDMYVANNNAGTVSVIGDVSSPPIPPVNEEPRTISDLIKGIIQNPLDITNSIDSANEIRDILTDNNRDNDQLVCDLIHSENEYTSNIREILNC
ncbi:MAG: YncE family protein [Candidatus Nitrosocosmicus sp.]|nr:YncE family protein [Candidatus Nitrosocosmicus sp.]